MIHRIVVPALLVASASTSWGVSYLNLVQAQEAIFPGAVLTAVTVELTPEQRSAIEKASGVKVRQPKLAVWKVRSGGWFVRDEVIGKHEFITFAVGIQADGQIKQIEVMDYRESYGHEIRKVQWRDQFRGRKAADPLRLDKEIVNISGATMSCRHVTEGVKRILTTHELVLKNL